MASTGVSALAVVLVAVIAILGTKYEVLQTARSQRWSALDERRYDAYQDLWRKTWPLSRHAIESEMPSSDQLQNVYVDLTKWYRDNGYLLTRESTRRWGLLTDALRVIGRIEPRSALKTSGKTEEERVTEIARLAYAWRYRPRRSRRLSWELPISHRTWKALDLDDERKNLTLLSLLSSDLRGALAADLLSRGSARDNEKRLLWKMH